MSVCFLPITHIVVVVVVIGPRGVQNYQNIRIPVNEMERVITCTTTDDEYYVRIIMIIYTYRERERDRRFYREINPTEYCYYS